MNPVSSLPLLTLVVLPLTALERPAGARPSLQPPRPALAERAGLPPRGKAELLRRTGRIPAITCGAAGVPIQAGLAPGLTVTGDTAGATQLLNNYTDGGTPIAPDLGGTERVYELVTPTAGDLRVYVQPNPGVDVDVVILAACDTDGALAYGDYAAVALAQPAGTYYVVVDTYNYGTVPSPVYFPGPFNLTAAVSSGLLLVDDDGSGDTAQCGGGCPDSRVSYTNALTAAGLPHAVYDVASAGPIPFATFARYKTVIWMTGGAYEPGMTMTAADQTATRLFLNLGGRMMVTGQDLLFDTLNGTDGRVPDGSVYNDLFQVATVEHDIDVLPPDTDCPTPGGLPGALSISGTVTTLTAQLLQGQTMCFDGPVKGRVTTDASGNYTIPNLPPGTYTYWPLNRSGAAPVNRQSTLVSGNSTGRNFVIQASPWPPGRNLIGVQDNPVGGSLPPFPAGNRLEHGIGIPDSTNSVTTNSDFRDYSMVIPAGATNFTVTTTNATGDVDLYVRLAAVPNTTTYTCAAATASGNETCVIASPAAGIYYIRVYGYATGAQPFTITGTYTFSFTGAGQALLLGAAPFAPYTDALTTRYGEPVYFTADSKVAGVMFNGTRYSLAPLPYSKTIFLAFEPALDATPGRLQALLTRAVEWLQADYDDCPAYDPGSNPTGIEISESLFSESGGTLNGYPDDGETVTYRMTLTNRDTVPHHFRIGFAARQTYVSAPILSRQTGAALAAGGTTTMDFPLTAGAAATLDIRTGETLSRVYNLVVASSTNTRGYYCRGAGYGSFVGQADILLVKDEGIIPNTTGIDVYATALKNLGRTWAVWDTAVFGHPPYGSTPGYLDNEVMTPYGATAANNYRGAVIWFTGYDFLGTLAPAFTGDLDAEGELTSLLNATSGRLFLSSQDYFWEKYDGLSVDLPAADFGYTQLATTRVNQDVVKDTISNVATENGTWATGGALNTLTANYVNNFADGTNLRTGLSYARQLARWESTGMAAGAVRVCRPGTDCAASATTNTLKLVFMPYAFENLADGGGSSNKQRILERMLCQFQVTAAGGSPAGTPPCGYSRPAPLTADLPVLTPLQTGPAAWQLRWNESPSACNGEAISGNWRVHGSTAATSQPFLRNAPAAPAGGYSATALPETPSAGQSFFYSVPFFVDDFGTAPSACP